MKLASCRGVTRGWAGVLVPTLGFYKNRGLGWAKRIKGKQNPKIPPILLFAYPASNPGDAPDQFLQNCISEIKVTCGRTFRRSEF